PACTWSVTTYVPQQERDGAWWTWSRGWSTTRGSWSNPSGNASEDTRSPRPLHGTCRTSRPWTGSSPAHGSTPGLQMRGDVGSGRAPVVGVSFDLQPRPGLAPGTRALLPQPEHAADLVQGHLGHVTALKEDTTVPVG